MLILMIHRTKCVKRSSGFPSCLCRPQGPFMLPPAAFLCSSPQFLWTWRNTSYQEPKVAVLDWDAEEFLAQSMSEKLHFAVDGNQHRASQLDNMQRVKDFGTLSPNGMSLNPPSRPRDLCRRASRKIARARGEG